MTTLDPTGAPGTPDALSADRLDAVTAERLARLILPSLHREYPNKIAHVLTHEHDVQPPRRLTPMFFGSFDWHSSVHSHWSVVRLLRLWPRAPWATEARRALAQSFTPDHVRGELAYLAPRPTFEMPYGMAWLLTLAGALGDNDNDSGDGDGDSGGEHDFRAWRALLAPLEHLAVQRFTEWLPRLSHPIRTGEHGQTAFAMGLALDYARAAGNAELAALVESRARDFYAADETAPVAYEPSAFDFLSPSLAEADLMHRVLPPGEREAWLARFLPRFDFQPVTPVDRADGKLVHFDGLNLSRAWMLRNLGQHALARAHAARGLQGVISEHYAGAHWLGSFAVYWFTCQAA